MHQKTVGGVRKSSSILPVGDIADAMPCELTTLVFTPTTQAAVESTLAAFENELTQSSDCFSDDDSSVDMPSSAQQQTERRLPGPKSSIRTEDMTPEQIRRRERRRERNKQAAARCRQRRIDITNQLLAETQKLEADSQKLEREIENLRKQKGQLQFVLDAHRPMCRGDVPDVKREMDDTFSNDHASLASQAARPTSLPIVDSLAPGMSINSLNAQPFDFSLGSTGFTPVVSNSGVSVFLGTGADIVSPTALLMTPVSTNA